MGKSSRTAMHAKRVYISVLALMLSIAAVFILVNKIPSVAYAASGQVALKAELKVLQYTAPDKVALTISVENKENLELSGISMNIQYPEQFNLISKEVKGYFENGVSSYGPDGANPMSCSIGCSDASENQVEFITKETGELVTFVFEANTELEKGQAYTFDVLSDTKLYAFCLKTDESAIPATTYYDISNAPSVTYTPVEGVTVSGNAVSWNDTDDAVYLLYDSTVTDENIKADIKLATPEKAEGYVAVKDAISQNTDNTKKYSQMFRFNDVVPGEYKLAVYKPNHGTNISIASNDNYVELNLLGDINGDGKITVYDINLLRDHILKRKTLEGYAFTCADVSKDNKLSVYDINLIRDYILKRISTF